MREQGQMAHTLRGKGWTYYPPDAISADSILPKILRANEYLEKLVERLQVRIAVLERAHANKGKFSGP